MLLHTWKVILNAMNFVEDDFIFKIAYVDSNVLPPSHNVSTKKNSFSLSQNVSKKKQTFILFNLVFFKTILFKKNFCVFS